VTVTGKLADASSNAGVGGKNITFDGTGAGYLLSIFPAQFAKFMKLVDYMRM
jgi:hypothetical protein